MGKSLAFIYNDKLNVWQATLVTVLIVAAMMLIAKDRGLVKQKKPLWAR